MKIIPFLIFILASSISHAQEKLVKLKGNNYNVYLKGFENRKPNTPAVEFFNLKTDANNERWKRFINSSTKGGALIYLTNCGHFVHRDDPKMVIANI